MANVMAHYEITGPEYTASWTGILMYLLPALGLAELYRCSKII
ncbi:hypothetical protein [Thermoanaerobacter thermocopriae]|nr:hypothetical protein [Thermoanaerobacter thermocopriae]